MQVTQDRISTSVFIMAGGAGTRFWPLSTQSYPKQFLNLLGDRTLLQHSYDRALLLAPRERVIVLTNEAFVGHVLEQLPDLPATNVVGEPMRRDTAAAVCLGALLADRVLGARVMAVLTADHLIEPVEEFAQAMRSAIASVAAEPEEGAGSLYTFGITPKYPATAYGYLQHGELVLDENGVKHFALRGFREKPDRETAEAYLKSGDFSWNSGMFVWRTSAILTELATHLPEHVRLLSAAVKEYGKSSWEPALREAFAALPSVSIDFGVMEKASRVRMVQAGFSWNDLGGWLALEEFLAADDEGNRHRGRIASVEAHGNLVFSEDPDELVALVGVDNLVVVRAGARTLVVDKSRAEDVKRLVKTLETSGEGRDV